MRMPWAARGGGRTAGTPEGAVACEPALPSRKRRAPGADAPTTQPRLRSGLAGLALLGSSRVARFVEGASVALGTVTAWCRPWFEITFDSGAVVSVQKRDLEASLLFSPADFFDPRHFFFDFGIFNPTRIGGRVAGRTGSLSLTRTSCESF